MRYLDPKLDPVFRKIFGEHKQLCRSLLNSILPLQPNQKIVSLTYKPPELPPDLHIFKDSIVDVYCVDNTGRQFIVEMQMYWTESFKQRVLFNSAKAYVRQLKQGGNYKLLKPVYALNFINEIFIKDSPEYYHDYKIVNIENTSEQIEGLELIFIELPKFKPSNRADKKLYDLWLTFLTEIKEDTEYIPPQLLKEKVTNEAINCLKMSSYTKKELEAYDCYWDSISTQKTLIDGKKEEGIEEGIEKGKKEGREEGIEKGIEKGKKEGREENLRDIVINCNNNDFSIEQIQKITGLNAKRIKEIINNSVGNNKKNNRQNKR